MRKRTPRAILTSGKVVKELRTKKGWTQALLANITGIAVSNISNIESGRSRLGEDLAILFAEALGVKPEFIPFPNGFERSDPELKLRSMREKLKELRQAS
jgi:transcriptional regulator with XRE-family HTH domain